MLDILQMLRYVFVEHLTCVEDSCFPGMVSSPRDRMPTVCGGSENAVRRLIDQDRT